MKTAPILKAVVIAVACAGVVGADNGKKNAGGEMPLVVPKVESCGPNDRPETALQGQVPMALRMAPGGFRGFNCNLTLIGQAKGDGANWQVTQFKQRVRQGADDDQDHDRGRGNTVRVCGYHGTASALRSLPGRTNFGVRALDLTDPRNPQITAYLNTPAMHDPWESLKVNERRQVLGADEAQNGGFALGGPTIDLYDLSQDCRRPQLIASTPVGTGTDGGIVAQVIGHEGSWAPDGLTYYGSDSVNLQYFAVDTADLARPKLISRWKPGIEGVHGLAITDDGNRGYFSSFAQIGAAALTDPNVAPRNGLLIYDLSEIQARKPNPQARLVSKLLWKDGSAAQHAIPVRIKGKPYVVFVDEGGSGGFGNDAQNAAACAAGMTPYPMARIIDISDEKNPKIVSLLGLETHDPANCSKVSPDVVGRINFSYGSHYCSVDNKKHATTLACGYFNSGIRVFDIRDPLRPKEIAYYNPPSVLTPSPGANHNRAGGWVAGGPDWCSAQVQLDAEKGTLWTTCQQQGVLVLKFREGVWPFPDSKTPGGEQN
jgi:hypothetical protein